MSVRGLGRRLVRKEQEGTFWGDRNIPHLDVALTQLKGLSKLRIVYLNRVNFTVCKLDLDKPYFKK